MISVKMNFDAKGLENKMYAIIERQANEILNRRLESIKSEIATEPTDRFVASIEDSSLNIKPEGFSPELTKKILGLFKD